MDLHPYLEALRRDLAASAELGGDEVARAAQLLAGTLEPTARLVLLQALSDAAAEITGALDRTGHPASVDVRLRGREADLVVTEAPPEEAAPHAAPAEAGDPGGETSRVTLRLPEPIKAAVETAASVEGISVNAWLVRAVTAAVHGGQPQSPGRARLGRRVTGFAQA